MDSLWSSDLYVFKTWDAGYCHTYNPPPQQSPAFENRIGLFLGHIHMADYDQYQFLSFHIYIHEKGQFWPKRIFKPVQKIVVRANELKVIEFYTDKVTKLKDENANCVQEKDYSLTSCLNEYIGRQVGCNLQWFSKSKYPMCKSNEELNLIRNITLWMKRVSTRTLEETSGCYEKCEQTTVSIYSYFG